MQFTGCMLQFSGFHSWVSFYRRTCRCSLQDACYSSQDFTLCWVSFYRRTCRCSLQDACYSSQDFTAVLLQFSGFHSCARSHFTGVLVDAVYRMHATVLRISQLCWVSFYRRTCRCSLQDACCCVECHRRMWSLARHQSDELRFRYSCTAVPVVLYSCTGRSRSS